MMKIKKTALFKFKPFSKKQRKVLNWWCPDSPVKEKEGIIADGAIRSGKTLAMSLSFVMWAMFCFQGNNFGMCGKTIGSFRRNVLFWLKLMLRSRGYKVEDKRSDNLLIVRRKDTINYFYIFGGKDERSQDLIQGITLAGVFFDEVALMPQSFVNQATGRCSVEGSKFWFNCNPDGPSHWFKVDWIDKCIEKNLIYLHFTMDDNLSLSEKIKARYRAMYTGVFFDRYILGLWKRAEGIIFRKFADNPSAFFMPEKSKLITKINIGVDFGGNKSKTVFVASGILGKFQGLQVLGDYKVPGEKGEIDPELIYTNIIEFTRSIEKDFGKVTFIFCDNESQYLINGIRNAIKKAGLNIAVVDCNKATIVERIQCLIELMGAGRFWIMPQCNNVINSLQEQVWNEEKEDERLDDGTCDIDTADALEYSFSKFLSHFALLKGR